MERCNVANGWCGVYNKYGLLNCKIAFCERKDGISFVRNCAHRKLINRLEKGHGQVAITPGEDFWDHWDIERNESCVLDPKIVPPNSTRLRPLLLL